MEKRLQFFQVFYIVLLEFYGKDKRKQDAEQSVFLHRQAADADTWHGGAGGIPLYATPRFTSFTINESSPFAVSITTPTLSPV